MATVEQTVALAGGEVVDAKERLMNQRATPTFLPTRVPAVFFLDPTLIIARACGI